MNAGEFLSGLAGVEGSRASAAGGATPPVLVAGDPDEPGMLAVLGPADGGPMRRTRAESLLDAVRRTSGMSPLTAVRHVAAEVDRLDSAGVG